MESTIAPNVVCANTNPHMLVSFAAIYSVTSLV